MATSVGTYKIEVPDVPEVGGQGGLTFHNMRLYRCTAINPIVWTEVREGRSLSVRLSADAVKAILDGAGTDAQKRAAILQLVIDDLMIRGLSKSHDAFTGFIDILPGDEWPEGGYSPTFELD